MTCFPYDSCKLGTAIIPLTRSQNGYAYFGGNSFNPKEKRLEQLFYIKGNGNVFIGRELILRQVYLTGQKSD